MEFKFVLDSEVSNFLMFLELFDGVWIMMLKVN